MALKEKVISTWRDFRDARRADRLTVEEYFAKLKQKGLNPDGTAIMDPVPIAPPIGYKKHPSMVEIVRDMVRGERLRQEAAAAGHETFEEAEDFDVGDEPEVAQSGWENDFDPPVSEVRSAVEEARKAAQEKKAGSEGAQPPAVAAAAAEPPKGP